MYSTFRSRKHTHTQVYSGTFKVLAPVKRKMRSVNVNLSIDKDALRTYIELVSWEILSIGRAVALNTSLYIWLPILYNNCNEVAY